MITGLRNNIHLYLNNFIDFNVIINFSHTNHKIRLKRYYEIVKIKLRIPLYIRYTTIDFMKKFMH